MHSLFASTYIRIWGYLYSAGIALQLYSALRFERQKRVQKSRVIPWEFWDEVFSLSMPSVCPHLTTVYTQLNKTKDNIGYALIQNILWMIIQIWLNTLPILVSLINSKSWINMVYRIPSGVAATIKCFIVLAWLTLICIVSFEEMKNIQHLQFYLLTSHNNWYTS